MELLTASARLCCQYVKARVGPRQSPLSLHFPTFYSIFEYLLLFPFPFLTRFVYFLVFSSLPILPE